MDRAAWNLQTMLLLVPRNGFQNHPQGLVREASPHSNAFLERKCGFQPLSEGLRRGKGK